MHIVLFRLLILLQAIVFPCMKFEEFCSSLQYFIFQSVQDNPM